MALRAGLLYLKILHTIRMSRGGPEQEPPRNTPVAFDHKKQINLFMGIIADKKLKKKVLLRRPVPQLSSLKQNH